MCGLFGFESQGGIPDKAIIIEIGVLASRRGPDSFGILTDAGYSKALRRLAAQDLSGIEAGKYLVGHCRLSTVLGTNTEAAIQPIVSGGFAVAHNGTVENLVELGINPASGNDSEAIAQLLDSTGRPLREVMAMIKTVGGYAIAAINLKTGQIELASDRMPLWGLERDGVRYWCSIKPADGWTRI